MASKRFTEEEMNHLRESHYVLDVTPNKVHFSVEFKREFWEALSRGKLAHDIFAELGIDSNILGKNRVNGLKCLIRKEARSGKGFRDLNTYKKHFDEYMNPEAKIHYLEQQLAYKEQELEFLKKIVSLGQAEPK